MTRNIADALAEMARRQPHTMAVVCPEGRDAAGRVRYTHYTYAQLDARANRLAAGLANFGVSPGTRTVLMAPPSLDFFALVFALFRAGAVLVCVDPGLGIRHLGRCLAEAEPAAFVGVPKAHLARKLFGWARKTLRRNIVVGAKRGWGLGTPLHAIEGAAASGDIGRPTEQDAAAILFTSGSTGAPKGVEYTHANFLAQIAALRDEFDIQPGEIDLATFPLFALFAPALGMTAIVPEMDFTRPADVDPRKIAQAIDDFGVTNMFGSPALLDRASAWGEQSSAKFSSLRRVISAGAPVPARVLERMTKLLPPGVQVFTPYGATESLPVSSIGSDEILRDTRRLADEGRGICVGRPVGEVSVRVIRITDEPIDRYDASLDAAPGEIGEVIVSGPAVTARYYGRPDATRLAKITDESACGGYWHRMGDLGYFDAAGRLWFCGRKSQRVRTASGDLYTIPCEGVFNAHPDVERSALVTIEQGHGVCRPAICIERRKESARSEQEISAELFALAGRFHHTQSIRDLLFHPAFPVDIRHNAKIGREALGRWATRQLKRRTRPPG